MAGVVLIEQASEPTVEDDWSRVIVMTGQCSRAGYFLYTISVNPCLVKQVILPPHQSSPNRHVQDSLKCAHGTNTEYMTFTATWLWEHFPVPGPEYFS